MKTEFDYSVIADFLDSSIKETIAFLTSPSCSVINYCISFFTSSYV